MTRNDKKRIEEIKTSQFAIACATDGALLRDYYAIEFLLAKLDEARQALLKIKYYAESGCDECDDWKDECEHIVEIASKALGEE